MKRQYSPYLLIFVLTLACIQNAWSQTPHVVRHYKFNSVAEAYGWYTKNNSFPQSAGQTGWAVAGPGKAYMGEEPNPPALSFSAGSAWNIFMSGVKLAAAKYGATPEKVEYMGYDYASVGFTDYDYDDAYLSKWFVSPSMMLKNGDQISFFTKEKNGGLNDALLDAATGNLDGMLVCTRPNRLEVRLSANINGSSAPKTGSTPESNGTFTRLLLTINEDLKNNAINTPGIGYPTDWTEYVVTVSGLPEGKLVSCNIGFVYRFEHAGYAGCEDGIQLEPWQDAVAGVVDEYADMIDEVADMSSKVSVGQLIFAAKVFSILATPQTQKGKNGTYVAIDDVKHTTFSKTHVTNNDSSFVWYDDRGPINPIRLAYKGSPDCYTTGLKSNTTFKVFNNSETETITFNASLLGGEGIFDYLVGDVPVSLPTTITLDPGKSKIITVKLKSGLPLSNDMAVLKLESGTEKHAIKLAYSIQAFPPPIAQCVPTRVNVILNDSGKASLINPGDYNLDSKSPEGCGSTTLRYFFSQYPSGNQETSKFDFTCEHIGTPKVYLVVRTDNSKATCPLNINVIRNATDGYTSVPETLYYAVNKSSVPLNLAALRRPKPPGICPLVGSKVLSIKKFAENVTDYASAPSLRIGRYQVKWELKPGGTEVNYFTSELYILDTVKPIASCADTTKIAFSSVLIIKPGKPTSKMRDDINAFRDIGLYSYDNSGDYDAYGGTILQQKGIAKYGIYSPWYSGTALYYADSFEINCSNIGLTFPVTLKVTDASGNYSTCQTTVKIIDNKSTTCKNVTVNLDPTTGIRLLTANELLLNGGTGGACGLQNVTLSKFSVTCADTNKTIPVTVGYTETDGTVKGCVSNVKVLGYSLRESYCEDTVRINLTTQSDYFKEFEPLLASKCGPAIAWSMWEDNYYYPSITGNKIMRFFPGTTNIARTSIYKTDTINCRQAYVITDTEPPQLNSSVTLANEQITLPTTSPLCVDVREIPNPFLQGSYTEWSYTFSGATTKTVLIKTNDEYGHYVNGVRIVRNDGWPAYWLDQSDSINPGITTVTLTATDYAGNTKTVSYTINLTVVSPQIPYVGWDIGGQFGNLDMIGDYCGTTYNYRIPSPVYNGCNQATYMWYYKVYNPDRTQVLFAKDSIPESLGADIPIPISNEGYRFAGIGSLKRYPVEFGYHGLTYGNETFSRFVYMSATDTASALIIPNQTIVVESGNTIDFTYDYTIPSPMKYGGSCSGGHWGYNVSGATNVQSTVNPSINYSANQAELLAGAPAFYSKAYPSIPADSNRVVKLKPGLNTIEYRVLEESGADPINFNNIYYIYNKKAQFTVLVKDTSTPVLTCPKTDTLHRSSGSCLVSVVDTVTQVNGFNGAFGKGYLTSFGGNNQVAFSQYSDSVKFSTKPGKYSNLDAYMRLEFNCSGTVSFTWEYKSDYPQAFTPFIIKNNFNSAINNQPVLNGINQGYLNIVQSGTYTTTVVEGDVLYIGMNEGGSSNGYFKITNFSAPHAYPSAAISKPIIAAQRELYYSSDFKNAYPIGVHTINHSLRNVNNGKTVTCAQTLVIIDDFATSLSCSNDTIYLSRSGETTVLLENVLRASCYPTSSTTLSKSTFTGSDIGTHSVQIRSINHLNDTVTCSFYVTLYDTLKPQPLSSKMTLTLPPSGTVTLPDSTIRRFFYDNHKVVNVSASQTNFTCEDVGSKSITVSATDSVGNTGTYSIIIEITPGFAPVAEAVTTIRACSKDSVTLSFETESGYSLSYQWQQKEAVDSIKHWNYYTCSQSNPFLSGTTMHKFFSFKNETYVAYISADASQIEFKKLDIQASNWRPALSPIYTPYLRGFTVHITPQYNEQLHIGYIDQNGTFYLKAYRPDSSNWFIFQQSDIISPISNQTGPVDFFTYATASPPLYGTASDNFFMDKIYGNDGFMFPIKNWSSRGQVFCVGYDNYGAYPQEYRTQTTDTIWDMWAQPFPKERFDLSSGNPEISYVANGKKIMAVRNNAAGQNRFFEMTFRVDGSILGRDSLSTDPTSGSSLFDIQSYQNNDYIAYKSANGKICVKKYDGANSWSTVGSLDFSVNQITKFDMNVVNNQLYLVYLETTGQTIVTQLDGNEWKDLVSPNENLGSSGGEPVSIVEINRSPALLFSSGIPSTLKLIRLDSWKNISGATAQTYKPSGSLNGTTDYRCIATSACISVPSQIKRLSVTPNPDIAILTKQANVVPYASTQLAVQTSGENVDWKYNFTSTSGVLNSGPVLDLPLVSSDAIYYAVANNGNCYSDTVSAKVYVIDSLAAPFKIRHTDTICYADYIQIVVDSGARVNFKYTLYAKDTAGVYQPTDQVMRHVGTADPGEPEEPYEMWTYVDRTQEFKIRVQEKFQDAVAMGTGYNSLNFPTPSLPITNQLTVEAWVLPNGSDNPSMAFSTRYASANETSWGDRNWEWRDGTFNVINAPQLIGMNWTSPTWRSLTFPPLPSYYEWVHVATTADSTGLKIYYNGVLVASNSSTAVTDINTYVGDLKIGVGNANTRGFDEFRVWNTARTASEIATNKDACLAGTESGLILYANFSAFNDSTSIFTSTKGPNSLFESPFPKIHARLERNQSCMTELGQDFFTEPFTVTMVTDKPFLSYYDDYYEQTTTLCDGELIPLYAISNDITKRVTWYNAPIGGDVVGITNAGNIFNFFTDKDTVLYPGIANSVCQRGETEIFMNTKPQAISAEVDPYCYGNSIGYNYFDINYDGNGYRLYETPTGGTPLDIDALKDDSIATQTDTLWVEAININWQELNGVWQDVVTCVSTERIPLIIRVIPTPKIVTTVDSSRMEAGSVTLKAVPGKNEYVDWFDHNWNYLGSWDSTFVTPILTTTTHYFLIAKDAENQCYPDEPDTVTAFINHYPTTTDTIIACESYMWRDGNTYTVTDSTISYLQHNTMGVDSLIRLNLTIVGFENSEIITDKESMCIGDSTLITIRSAQNGYHYMLIDSAANTIVRGPVVASGGDIVFNTGALMSNKAYKVMATDTAVVSNYSLGCAKQIGSTVNLKVGSLFSSSDAATCGSYWWRGTTYTQSGTYYDTLTSSQGCDSVVAINLSIFPVPVYVDSVTACNSYTWNGITYTASTSAPTRFAGYTEYGCDSFVRLHLTITHPTTATDTRIAWDSYTWMDGITYTASNNTAMDTIVNVAGCDSVITLNLTILNSAARTVLNPQAVCAGGSYAINNKVYTTSGTYRDTLYAGTGNDTVYVTQLTVNPKPATSAVSGPTNPALGSTQVYSVTNTTGSTYNWILTNGTQVSGGNSNTISVLWSNTIVAAAVKVIETSTHGCLGDTVTQNVVLPVSLLTFTAHKNNKVVELNWNTSSEFNNKGFDVERSFDAISFETLGFVNGKGTTNQPSYYRFEDETYKHISVEPLIIYYRLKQIDFNGAFDYSQVVALKNQTLNNKAFAAMAMPNPFQTGFNLNINSKNNSEAIIEIFDSYGKRITTQTTHLTAGDTFVTFEQANEWKAGMYFVVVWVDDERQTIRIVKEE